MKFFKLSKEFIGKPVHLHFSIYGTVKYFTTNINNYITFLRTCDPGCKNNVFNITDICLTSTHYTYVTVICTNCNQPSTFRYFIDAFCVSPAVVIYL